MSEADRIARRTFIELEQEVYRFGFALNQRQHTRAVQIYSDMHTILTGNYCHLTNELKKEHPEDIAADIADEKLKLPQKILDKASEALSLYLDNMWIETQLLNSNNDFRDNPLTCDFD